MIKHNLLFIQILFLLKKMDECKYNPGKSSTKKIGEHTPSRFLMSKTSLFKDIESKHDVYRRKDCMEKFFKCLKNHAKKIFKKMKLLRN